MKGLKVKLKLSARSIGFTLICLAWAWQVEGKGSVIPTTFNSFKDYLYYRIPDPDSVEKIIYAHHNKPKQFLNELIWLEICRFNVSDRFGRDLEKIRSLSVNQRFPLGVAVYNALRGRFNRHVNLPTSLAYLTQAHAYFKRSKDTSGLIYVQSELLKIYLSTSKYDKKSFKTAQFYFNNTAKLIQTSSFAGDNIQLLKLIEVKKHFVKYTSQEQEREFQKIYLAINSDIRFKLWMRQYYAQYAEFLMSVSRDKEALPNALRVLSYFPNGAEFRKITPYIRIATIYYQLKDWHQAEVYYHKALALIKPNRHEYDENRIECYNALININLRLKRIENIAQLIARKDSLTEVYNQNLEAIKIVEIQRKYETERTKMALEMKTERVQSQNNVLIICLVGLLLLALPVTYLLVKLRQRNTQLKDLQAARDRFYTIIAHDLRTPINSMQGIGQLIRNLLKQDRKDDIEKIFKQIDLMEQHSHLVLDNLMEWGKLQYFENISSTSQQKIDLKPRIEEIVQYYLPIAQAKGIDIATNLCLSFVVQTDVKGLVIVLRNLIDNAVKYTPKNGKIVVSTKVEPYSQATGKVTYSLTVADTGEGIPPEKLHHLKQVFSQKIKAEVGMGLGLGMVLIEHFVRKNKASVSIDSTLGQGTSISIQFA